MMTIRALAVLALLPSAAHAAPDTDFPHRDWGKVATLDMRLSDASTCVARAAARKYERIVPIPVEGGTDIDAGPGGGFFGVANDPWLRYQVRQEGSAVTLRIFYRHPVGQRRVDKELASFQKQCLRVRSIAAA